MATVQVRDLDEVTYNTLRTRAASAGKSLQAYLRELLIESARQSTLAEVFARVEVHTGGRLGLAEATATVRADRDAR
jgi:plasmid stability protein